MFCASRWMYKAMVPYASLFAHNLVLERVFQTAGSRVAFVREVPGSDSVSYTYGRLQRDIIAMANLLVARRNKIAGSITTDSNTTASTNTKTENTISDTNTNHCHTKQDNSNDTVSWLQATKPNNVQSIFAQGDRVPSCDVLHDTGYYNTAVMSGPGYTFLVCMLASWAVNQLVTPMSVSQVYNDELMYVLDHSGCRTILGETELLKSKFPSVYDAFRVSRVEDVTELSSAVRDKVNRAGYPHFTAPKTIKNSDAESKSNTMKTKDGTNNINTMTSNKLSDKVNSTFCVDTVMDVKQILEEISNNMYRHVPSCTHACHELDNVEVLPADKEEKINTAEDVINYLRQVKNAKAETTKEKNQELETVQFMEQDKKNEQEKTSREKAEEEEDNDEDEDSDEDGVLQYDADDVEHSLNSVFRQWHTQPDTRPSVQDDCLMVYTSGTTARPKGAVHTHSSVNNMIRVLQRAWQWHSEDSILSVLPVHHVHGLVNVHFCALASAARCVSTNFDSPSRIARRIAAGDITLFMAVPTIYTKLISSIKKEFSPIEQSAFRHACVEHVRLMVSGSAALPVPTLEQFHALSGHVLLERYGMTELGMALSQPLRPISERIPGTVGYPLPTVIPYVYEPHSSDNTSTADGNEGNKDNKNNNNGESEKEMNKRQFEQVGALAIASESLFDRYWNNPAGTRKELYTSPQGVRYFDTGDTVGVNYPHGTEEPGVFTILGRSSVDIIKSRGYKLSALEIEAELLSRKDLFYEVAIVSCKDEVLGEAVVAIVALQPDAASTRQLHFESEPVHGIENEELTKEMKQVALTLLAPYKCPKRYIFVREIPRNATGKVNKKNLKKLLKLD